MKMKEKADFFLCILLTYSYLCTPNQNYCIKLNKYGKNERCHRGGY
jgi:hypothetical protein